MTACTVAFSSTMYIDVHSEVEASNWIKDFEYHTDTTDRITGGVQAKGKRYSMKLLDTVSTRARKQP